MKFKAFYSLDILVIILNEIVSLKFLSKNFSDKNDINGFSFINDIYSKIFCLAFLVEFDPEICFKLKPNKHDL